MKKCEICSKVSRSIYHVGRCPFDRDPRIHIWLKGGRERQIEKADRYLKMSGIEPRGAKGWI